MKHSTLYKNTSYIAPALHINATKLKATKTTANSLFLSKLVIAFVMVMLFSVASIKASTRYWVGGVGDDPKAWNVDANWNRDSKTSGIVGVPQPGDDIIFNTGSSGSVIFSILPSAITCNSLTLDAYITLASNDQTTITVGGKTGVDFTVPASRELTLSTNVSIVMAAGSEATITGTFVIQSLGIFDTQATGAVTTVTGLIDNRGGTVANTLVSGNLIFDGTSTYQHWRMGGAIPKATWAVTSTCNIRISGMKEFELPGLDNSSLDQVFGNLIYNVDINRLRDTVPPDPIDPITSLAPYLKTVMGNLEIEQTGSSEYETNRIILVNAATGTLNIGGTFKIGGYVVIEGGTVNAGITTVFRKLDEKRAVLTVSGGTVNLASLTIGPHVPKPTDTNRFFNPLTILNLQGGSLNITGDLYINRDCSFTCLNSPALNIGGNITNNGSYYNKLETVTLIGSSSRTIGGAPQRQTSFYNLNINNAAGVTFNIDVSVSNTLTFTNGKITTAPDKALILGQSATAISGAGAGRYVNGNLKINIAADSGPTTKTFEIGDATQWTPVALTLSGTTNGSGNIMASSSAGDHANIATSNISDTKSVNRTWTLTNSGVTFGTYTAVFNFNSGDLDGSTNTNIFIVQRFLPSTWYSATVGTRNTTNIQITGGTQNQFGTFQVGEPNCVVPTSGYTVTGGGSYCSSTSSAIGLSGSQTGVDYQLKYEGADQGSAISGNNAALSFGSFSSAGAYTVLATNTAQGGCSVIMGPAIITIISPTITAGFNSPVCSGNVLSLNATSIEGATYSWAGPNSYSSTEQNPIVEDTVKTTMAGTYTVTASVPVTSGTCTIISSTVVTVNSSSVVVAKSATEIGATSFKANWNAASNATGYHLDVSTDFSFSTYLSSYNDFNVGAPIFQTVSGLTSGINNYYYRVRAVNANCPAGLNSNVIIVTLPAKYRSVTSGDWDNKDIWQVSYDNGLTWEFATYPPSSSDYDITIQYGNTVTITKTLVVDQLTVEAGCTLIHNAGVNFTINEGTGTDLLVNGTLISKATITNNGTISFGAGGLYQHIRSGSKKSLMSFTDIPIATWDPNSTCEILSVAGTPSAAGLNQAFGNFTWNFASQSTAINLGGLPAQVTGNFTIVNTGTGELQLASTTSTLNVGGNLNVLGGQLTLNSGAFATTIAVSVNTLVQTDATLAMGSGIITGAGDFTLNAGAELWIGSPNGITSTPGTGNIQVTGTRTYDAGANYKYNSSANQVTGNDLPQVVNNFIVSTIDNSTTVTLSDNISCSGILNISVGKLIVPSLLNVTVIGETTLGSTECLVLKSDATGTASYIDNGTISGSGTARIERYLSKYNTTDDRKFHFISSPVGTDQAIDPMFSDPLHVAGTDFYKWDEPSNMWINYRGASANTVNASFGDDGKFVAGKGYLVAYPTDVTKNFIGKPYTNSSELVLLCTFSNGGWNLFGNPFPSAIDWDFLVLENAWFNPDDLDNSLYYYNNDLANYCYYNTLSGGTGGATKNIPAMQGFMVHANSDSYFSLNNDARIHVGQTNYFKSTPLTNNILNLNVKGNAYSDQARVCFYDYASANFDSEYDAYKLFSYNASVPQLYSITPDNTNVAINTLPLDDMYGDVPLGFTAGVDGTYTITADGIGSFPSDMLIKLEDIKTGITQKLNDKAAYSFTYATTDDANRFILHFKDAASEEKPELNDSFTVLTNSGAITITALTDITAQVNIIDMSGRKIKTSKLIPESPSRIDMQGHFGVYIVNIVSSEGVVNKKVVVR